MARRGVDVGVMKPIATGGRGDARFLRAAAGGRDPIDLVNPICLEPPLSPHLASRIARRPIDLSRVWRAYAALRARHEELVVEGVGGLMVPIRRGYYVADVVRRLRLPLVIVTRPTLGTINHTLLTVMAARRYRLRVLGLVVNCATRVRGGLAERLNPAALEDACDVRVLGRVPFLGAGRAAKVFDRVLTELERARR
jgi:dethiobiotin synthetase